MSRIIVATEAAGTTLLKALLNEIRQLPKPWEQTPEKEQEVVIDRLRHGVESAVRGLVSAIATSSFPSIPCVVESVTFKDGVKAAVKLSKGHEGTHALADATGGAAMIVLASSAEFLEGMNQVQADSDQAQLDLGEPADEAKRELTAESWQALIDSLEQGPTDDTAPDGGEPPPVKSMGQQVHEFLAAVHVHVELDVCEAWTEQECTAAAYWAIQFAKDADSCKIARPHWLPLPNPPTDAAPSSDASEGKEHGEDDGKPNGEDKDKKPRGRRGRDKGGEPRPH